MSHKLIQIQNQPVQLVRKRIKNLNLSVRGPEGQVRVSAPLRTSEQDIRLFVESRLGWIRKHQGRLAQLPARPQFNYVSGELHPFMGREYLLQVSPAASRRVYMGRGGVLHLQLPAASVAAERQQLLEAWYREQLQQRIPPLIEKYQPRMGVRVAQWRIRKMKTRWGTCNIAKRRIWINLELAKLPAACLEYIVVHEMTHLLERGHNARFYALMDRFLPNWQAQQGRLREQMLV